MSDQDREFITSLSKEAEQLAGKHKLPEDVVALFEKLNNYVKEETRARISIHFMHECHLFTNLITHLESEQVLKDRLRKLCEHGGYHSSVGLDLAYGEKRSKQLAFIHGRGEEKFDEFANNVWQAVEKARQEHGEEPFVLGKIRHEKLEARRKQDAKQTA